MSTLIEQRTVVDLSIYKQDFLEEIQDMQVDEKVLAVKDDILKKFPVCYDVLLEHENTIETAFWEMHKLTYFRARLKVLVTYIWDPSKKKDDKWDYAHNRLCKNFASIIQQMNAAYPEHGETEYILITGQRVNQKLNWKYTTLKTVAQIQQVDI